VRGIHGARLPVNGDCDIGGFIVGSCVFVLGCGLVGLGVFAWRRPDLASRFLPIPYPSREGAPRILRFFGLTEEQSRERQVSSLRVGAPLVGAGWAIMGCIGIVSGARCAVAPLFMPLSLRIWPPMFVFTGVVALIAIIGTRRSAPRERAIVIPGLLLWSFAGGEAAAFHVGSEAGEWAAISFIALFAMAAALAVARFAARSGMSPSSSRRNP
jgi:hypothetical protein